MEKERFSRFTFYPDKSGLHVSRYSFIVIGVLLLSFLLPMRGFSFSLCPFHWITGIPCFGCGLTRSVCSISSGHILAALEYHPFGLVAYALLIGLLSYAIFPSVRRRFDSIIQQKSGVVSALKWSVLVMFMLFGALRMYYFLF